jgi:hypothetical protein
VSAANSNQSAIDSGRLAVPPLDLESAVERRVRAFWWYSATTILAVLVLFGQLASALQGNRHSAVMVLVREAGYFSLHCTLVSAGVAGWRAWQLRPTVSQVNWAASIWFRLVQLYAVSAGCLSALVYFLLIRPTVHWHSWVLLVELGMHYAIPVLLLVGWLRFDPVVRMRLTQLPVVLALPLIWVLWVLTTGYFFGTYPYPFINVAEHGYLTSLANGLAVTVSLGLGATGFWWMQSRRRVVR